MEKIKNILEKDCTKDILIIGLLVIIYGIMSFYHLGINDNPQSFSNFSSASTQIFELEKETSVSKIRYFLGDREGKFQLYVSKDGSIYTVVGELNGYTLSWNDIQVNDMIKYIKITSNSGNIGEMQVYDKYSNKASVAAVGEEGKKLLDEPNTVPDVITYENSAYFDEIYFATSAYEYANGEPATEYTHPHLGKILQTIPVVFFGITPFSYRLMNNLAGIGIVIVMYILGKLIFKKRLYAFLPAFLMAFDNFHFAQTRIGTVDGILIFFCLLSSLFMYKYFTLDSKASMKKKLINLFFCGLFFGCAVATKWMGFYTGLGLALIFFGKMIYETIKEKKFDKQNIVIMIACVIFFIMIPSIMYVTMYFNFETVHGKINDLNDFFKITGDMFNFHSTLTATHPFSSLWYTWPIMQKPVWFYVANINATTTSTICNLGNPAVWWFGVVALIYVLAKLLKNIVLRIIGKDVIFKIIKKDKEIKKGDIFIIVMYLSVWLPYVFIGRVMFLYHYFMALPFVIFAITALIKFLYEKFNKKWIVLGYMLIVVVMFWTFYPVSSGRPVSKSYVNSLHWIDTWIF